MTGAMTLLAHGPVVEAFVLLVVTLLILMAVPPVVVVILSRAGHRYTAFALGTVSTVFNGWLARESERAIEWVVAGVLVALALWAILYAAFRQARPARRAGPE